MSAKVLIAGEEWAQIREACISLGLDAWSCDLKPSRIPGQHLQCDWRDVLYQKWDALVAHPVCRYLTNAGARWLYEPGTTIKIPERWKLMEEGVASYNEFVDAKHIPVRIVENPIMHGHAAKLIHQVGELQYLQPYELGDPYTKRTGFRLIGIPKIAKTHKKSDYPKIIAECHKMGPGPERESLRSRTYPAVAKAIARHLHRHIFPNGNISGLLGNRSANTPAREYGVAA